MPKATTGGASSAWEDSGDVAPEPAASGVDAAPAVVEPDAEVPAEPVAPVPAAEEPAGTVPQPTPEPEPVTAEVPAKAPRAAKKAAAAKAAAAPVAEATAAVPEPQNGPEVADASA